MSEVTPMEILEFWQTAGATKWWRKDLKFDAEIKSRFSEVHAAAAKGELDNWRENCNSCLALVIILDQFSRNLFRGSDKAFAHDPYGLELAKHAILNGYDKTANETLASFLFLPFMHSEQLSDQEACIKLMREDGNKSSLEAAIEHRDIIKKFGRFPHRNSLLGRQTTPQEKTFLDDGGFSG